MTTAAAKLPARAWLTVWLLFFLAAFNYLDRVSLSSMRASVTSAIPMSEAQFGLLTSGLYWVYGCFSPFGGFLSDRFSRKRILVASLLTWSAATWLLSCSATFGQFLAIRMLVGMSEACAIPAGLALIADYHRGPTRSFATGLHMCGIQTGTGLSGFGGVLAEKYGWDFPFRLFGMLGVGYGIALIFLLRDGPREEAGGAVETTAPPRIGFGKAIASLFSRGSFILALAYWALLGIMGGSLTGWLPTYLGEQFHLTQGRAGVYATAYLQPASMVGLLIGGWWADRWSRSHPRARVLVPVVGLCIAAPAILIAANTGALAIAMGCLILYYLAKASTDANMMPILCLVADPRYRATGYGVLNFFSCFVIGVIVYVGGALRDAHVPISRVFECGALGLLVCAGLLFLVKPAKEGGAR